MDYDVLDSIAVVDVGPAAAAAVAVAVAVVAAAVVAEYYVAIVDVADLRKRYYAEKTDKRRVHSER